MESLEPTQRFLLLHLIMRRGTLSYADFPDVKESWESQFKGKWQPETESLIKSGFIEADDWQGHTIRLVLKEPYGSRLKWLYDSPAPLWQ